MTSCRTWSVRGRIPWCASSRAWRGPRGARTRRWRSASRQRRQRGHSGQQRDGRGTGQRDGSRIKHVSNISWSIPKNFNARHLAKFFSRWSMKRWRYSHSFLIIALQVPLQCNNFKTCWKVPQGIKWIQRLNLSARDLAKLRSLRSDDNNSHYHIVRLIIHSKWKAEQFGLLNSIIRLVMNNKANNGNYSPSYG